MQTITPCLWFDTEAEEAAAFYTSLFDDSEAIDNQANEPAQASTPTAPSSTPKPKPTASPSRSSQTHDLSKVCAA